jgi:hypothetical protein
MTVIEFQQAVSDGFDVRCLLDDGSRRTFHFPMAPQDVPAAIEAILALENQEMPSELDQAKVIQTARVKQDAADYVGSRYAAYDQQLFTLALIRAANPADPKPNQAAYLGQLADWIEAIAAANLAVQGQIAAAGTLDEVAAVRFDGAAFDATDPMITFAGLAQITG